VADRCADPAVPQRVDVDLALMAHEDRLRRAGEAPLGQTAPQPRAPPRYRRQSIPGPGKILSSGRRSPMHDSTHYPRGQACVAAGRLVICARAAVGHHYGAAGATSGPVASQGAVSNATGAVATAPSRGQTSRARVANPHGAGHAWTLCTPTLARAVYDMRTRDPGVARSQVRHGSGRAAGEPHASLDASGRRLG
jgi:hypothetical protein